MKKLTSAPSLVTITHYKNVLASEGIPAVIRKEHVGSVFGQIPIRELWPELWVKNDLDYDRARELIDEATDAPESDAPPWRCRQCGADNEGQFAACWNCGTAESADA